MSVVGPTHWETVGKPKKNGKVSDGGGKEKGGGGGGTKSDTRKFIENAPKVEDVLPLNQVATLFNIFEVNKKTNKPKTKEVEPKKPDQKKVSNNTNNSHQNGIKKKSDGNKREAKEKLPRTLDEAIKKLKEEELTNLMTSLRIRFPENRLVWMRDIASFLNVRLNNYVDANGEHSDPAYTGKRPEYPSSQLPIKIRRTLEALLQSTPLQVQQIAFNSFLASMAHDMLKGLTANGYKIFLQLMSLHNPKVVLSVLPIFLKDHWNSYQNRQAIGLSLLWAVGQCGVRGDLSLALKVWMELMLPAIHLKNYSRYVVDYLAELFKENPGGGRGQSQESLSQKDFFALMDLVFSAQLGVHPLIRKDLLAIYPKMKTCAFGSSSNNANNKRLRPFFAPLLSRLLPAAPQPLREELLSCLLLCLSSDSTYCFQQWSGQLYPQHLSQSAVLLGHFNQSWKALQRNPPQAHVVAGVKQAVMQMDQQNKQMMGKGSKLAKLTGLKECNKQVQFLMAKMNRHRSFPWRWANLFLLAAIVTLVAYDVRNNGSFKDSSVGRFLTDVGLMPHCELAAAKVRLGYEWACINGPRYWATTMEVCRPYLKVVRDGLTLALGQLANLMANIGAFVRVKAPMLVDKLNSYAPGLSASVQHYSWEAWLVAQQYFGVALEFLGYYVRIAFVWLKENVFVGQLSPENLQKYTWNALDAAQQYALKTYEWVSHQVTAK